MTPVQGAPTLSPEAFSVLSKTRRWAWFMAVITGLMTISLALATLVSLGDIAKVDRAATAFWTASVVALMPGTVFAWRYASHLAGYLDGRTPALTDSFRALRHGWIVLTLYNGLSVVYIAAELVKLLTRRG